MINLRPITWDNMGVIIEDLRVDDAQKNFVATNSDSLADAYVAQNQDPFPATTFAIYNDDEPVGFSMTGYFVGKGSELAKPNGNTSNEYTGDDSPCYFFWRFMIDKRFQGKGYGKAALEQILNYLRTKPQGEAEHVYTSIEPANEGARKLYKSFGFEEDGRVIEGEEVMKMKL